MIYILYFYLSYIYWDTLHTTSYHLLRCQLILLMIHNNLLCILYCSSTHPVVHTTPYRKQTARGMPHWCSHGRWEVRYLTVSLCCANLNCARFWSLRAFGVHSLTRIIPICPKTSRVRGWWFSLRTVSSWTASIHISNTLLGCRTFSVWYR